MPIKLSIIVATYNWPNALGLVLDNLSLQLKQVHDEVEIIIADDGSTKVTQELVKHYQTIINNLKHVWHPDNGFQKSIILNKAVLAAQGDYLLFLDGDCVPFPDYIHNHLQLKETGYFVAGDRILCSQNFTQQILVNAAIINEMQHWHTWQWIIAKLHKKVNKCFAHFRIGLNHLHIKHLWNKPLYKWRYFAARNWRRPKGCNFAIHKADFLAVNGFDANFCGWGHEDADLFVRLLHYGLKIKNGRLAIPVIHLWHPLSSRKNAAANLKLLLSRASDTNCIQAQVGIRQITLDGSNRAK